MATGVTDGSEKADLYRRIAAAQAAVGDPANAARTFESAVQAVVALRTTVQYATGLLADIARAQVETGDPGGARATFRRAIEIARATGDRQARDWALATLAGITDDSRRADAARQVAAAQARGGQAAEALAWASRETSPLVRAHALLGVAEGILGKDSK